MASPANADVVISPQSIETELNTGDVEATEITISNRYDGAIDYTVEIEVTGEPERAAGPDRDRRSEPDDMGWEWRDNLEDDGPEYAWLARGDFEEVREWRLGDDANTGALELGFLFPFWDQEYDRLFGDTDGYCSFTYAGTAYNLSQFIPNYPIQANAGAVNHALIAQWQTDMTSGTEIWFWTNESDMAIMWWAGNHEFHHQVILHDNGLCVMQYGENIAGRGAYVGVNHGDGDHGWYIAEPDQEYLVEGRAIAFGGPSAWTQWVSADPEEGSIDGNSEDVVTILLDANGLVGFDAYAADVHFITTEGRDDDVVLTIDLSVLDAPNIVVEWSEDYGYPDVVDWNLAHPDVFFGTAYDMVIEVSNNGTEDLDIDDIYCEHAFFSVAPVEAFLAPGEAAEVTITFNADQADDYFATLVLHSNDPVEANYEVPLHAHGFAPPGIEISPMTIEIEVFTGAIERHDLTVSNTGDAPLTFAITHEITAEPERDAMSRSLRSVYRAGPRRDDVEDVADMLFAVFQTQAAWGWLSDVMLGREELLDGNYDSYRSWNDFNDLDFEQYDVMVFNASREPANIYNDNLERFTDYIDGGGAAYFEMGDPNQAIRVPGNFVNNAAGNRNGVLVCSPDPDDDNYSYLAEVLQSTQPNNWNEGEVIEGSSFLHSSYQMNQFQDAFDNGDIDWFQHIAVPQGAQTGGIVAYGLGSGTVLTVGHPTGHCWVNFNQVGMWGSACAEVLYYLSTAGGAKWLAYEPDEGEIAGDDQMIVVVTLDATGLIGGTYEASLFFATNIDDDVPEVAIIMDVTAAADIVVEWPEEFGYIDPPEDPDDESVVNWNLAHPDVFCGGPYDMVVEVSNNGTADLDIDDIYCEFEGQQSAYFSVVPVELFLAPGEDAELTITYEAAADDPGLKEATLFLHSNDPDEGLYEVALRAHGYLPPRIVINPGSIEEALFTGGRAEHTLTVSNEGDAELRFVIESEIIAEPERDAMSRTLRGTDGKNGPRRDEPGDLIAEFVGPNQVNIYCSPVGWDPENEVMFFNKYNSSQVFVYSHNNYEDFEQVRVFATNNPMDGGFYEGVIYICNLNVNASLRRFDFEGNNLGDLAMGFATYGVAFDTEEGWMFARSQNAGGVIQVYQMDGNDRGEQIGTLPNPSQYNGGNANCYNIEWVAQHTDGQMWIANNATQSIYQISVDTDNWEYIEAVQNFNAQITQPYDAVAHDGLHMWVGGWGAGNIRIYD
ncbi:hypothetical protein HQ587_01385, partial [bacterium]|nr:hypothetical protein [bacterium]